MIAEKSKYRIKNFCEPKDKVLRLMNRRMKMNELNLLKQGDEQTFSSLIESVKLKLYKTGMAILKNDDDTCDAIQETLMAAYQKFDTLRNKEYFTTWIIRIMINKCYDIIRKNKKVVDINQKITDITSPYYEMYCEESEVEQILNKIDSDLKVVAILYYYDDLSVSEIAQTLNIPEGTVKSRLSRARKSISEIYQLEEGGE